MHDAVAVPAVVGGSGSAVVVMHGFADASAQGVVAVGGLGRLTKFAGAGEAYQAVGAVVPHSQAVTVGGVFFDQVACTVIPVAGALMLSHAVIGDGLLAVEGVACGIHHVAVGLVAVLAAGEAAGGIVAIRYHFGLIALQGAEVHPA
ncbi:hypothetical protein [Halomonas dongshanensis]|uniref:Uncharacterized protein n=1 Tax=Halomonas dongshanensis TaxID=2890835 RepID=A0ABT2EA19_9GAMM|nr:hypothetical protein [Halomonas dongshanensis]MCS2608400.1 hypothetical protein [Halomonas dongshanensis]